MKKALAVITALILLTMTTQSFGSEVDCEKTVKNGIAILIAKMKEKNPEMDDKYSKALNNPKSIASGVEHCQEDIQTDEGWERWACQETAETYKELFDCEA